jgi:hypothetical protein
MPLYMAIVAAFAYRGDGVGQDAAAPGPHRRLFDSRGDDGGGFGQPFAKRPQHVLFEPVVFADRFERQPQITHGLGAFDLDEADLKAVAAPEAHHDGQHPRDEQTRDEERERHEHGMRDAEHQIVHQIPEIFGCWQYRGTADGWPDGDTPCAGSRPCSKLALFERQASRPTATASVRRLKLL